MVTKKSPAITHSVRIPVSLSADVQVLADNETGGNFSQKLVKIIEFYFDARKNIGIKEAKKKTKKKK